MPFSHDLSMHVEGDGQYLKSLEGSLHTTNFFSVVQKVKRTRTCICSPVDKIIKVRNN